MTVGELIISCVIVLVSFLVVCLVLILLKVAWQNRKDRDIQIGVSVYTLLAIIVWLNYKYPEFSIENFMHYKLW